MKDVEILRRPEVERLTGLSRSTIYGMLAKQAFPKPIRIGKRAVGWKRLAVEEWLSSRPESR